MSCGAVTAGTAPAHQRRVLRRNERVLPSWLIAEGNASVLSLFFPAHPVKTGNQSWDRFWMRPCVQSRTSVKKSASASLVAATRQNVKILERTRKKSPGVQQLSAGRGAGPICLSLGLPIASFPASLCFYSIHRKESNLILCSGLWGQVFLVVK